MLCLCKNKVAEANHLMASLNTAFAGNLNFDVSLLPKINLALALALDLDVLPHLPPLVASLPAMSLAAGTPSAGAMSSLALAVLQFRAAFGINLFDLKAQAQLDLLAKSLGHLSALQLPSLSLGLMMNLSLALSAMLNAKLALKLKLFDDLSLKLGQALAPLTALPPWMLSVGPISLALGKLINLALVIQAAKLAFGLDLGAPGAAARLGAALSAMASLRLPSLAIALPKLQLLLAALQLQASLKAALGVNVAANLGAAKSGLASALAVMASVRLPQLPSLSVSLGGLKLALGLPPLALKLDLSPLSMALGGMPSFSGLTAVASLALALKANLGLDLVAKVPCSAICPVA